MITVTLSRKEFINLIRGTNPSYEIMNNPLVDAHGSYRGGFHDDWFWDYASSEKWDTLSDEGLVKLYNLVKKEE
jgi:hypothetical protein